MSELKQILVSRDCTVQIDVDGLITITNSLIKGGTQATYCKDIARSCLRQILSFGDEIPHGVLQVVEDVTANR
jgi:hypothetical protein